MDGDEIVRVGHALVSDESPRANRQAQMRKGQACRVCTKYVPPGHLCRLGRLRWVTPAGLRCLRGGTAERAPASREAAPAGSHGLPELPCSASDPKPGAAMGEGQPSAQNRFGMDYKRLAARKQHLGILTTIGSAVTSASCPVLLRLLLRVPLHPFAASLKRLHTTCVYLRVSGPASPALDHL